MDEKIVELIDKKFVENYERKGQKTYIKAVVTGHIIEIYEYEKMPVLPSRKKKTKEDPEDLPFDFELSEEQKRDSNRYNNMIKARNNLRRLINANFDNTSKFITLTFADGSISDVTDIDQADAEFKKFIQRMRYAYGNFKYITVVEFQDKNGRGAVHYHMISDLPFISNDKLREIWRNGFVKINKVSHVDNVGAYMVKYMIKDLHDERLRGRKSYRTSRGNLERPQEFTGDIVREIKNIYDLDNKKTVFMNSYNNEHLGLTTYKEYNLKRL